MYLTGSYLTLDAETSNTEYGTALNDKNVLILASWKSSKEAAFHTHVGDERHQRELIAEIKKHDFLVAHNAKFELQWLSRMGVDIATILCYDTMLGEWVIAGNRRVPKDLNSTASRYGVGEKEHHVAKLISLGVNPINIPTDWLGSYCEQDVRITEAIFLQQRQLIAERGQLHLQLSRCLLTPVLADIEANGVTLDKKEVYDEYERIRKEYEENTERLDTLAADAGLTGINWRSRQQVAALLYDKLGFDELKGRDKAPDRTAAGQRRTDAVCIGSLRTRTAVQREFKALFTSSAKLSAKLTKTLNFFKGICDEHEGTFYGIFHQGTTGTHRLSSGGRKIDLRDVAEGGGLRKAIGIQLQNMPREYKRLVRAKQAGWEIVEADGSQLEFRVAADLGHDPVAYKEIDDGADIHTITAETLTKAGEETDRQSAKSRTFRPLYGGTSGTPAEQAYCKFFQEKYSGIYKEQRTWVDAVLRSKELITPYGIRFYWPDTKVTRSGYVTNTTSIFNYPVQGFATAEIIPIAVVFAWHKLRSLDVRIILTIHDSVVLEVGPAVDRNELAKILATCFTTDVYTWLEVVYGYKFHVPLGCSVKIGSHWGKGKEASAKVYPNQRDRIIWKSKD